MRNGLKNPTSMAMATAVLALGWLAGPAIGQQQAQEPLRRALSAYAVQGQEGRAVNKAFEPFHGAAELLSPGQVHGNQSYFLWSEGTDPATGLALAEVDATLRSHLDLPEGAGLLVNAVGFHTPASEVGIQKDDILLELGGRPLKSADDLHEALKEAGDKTVELKLLRRKTPVTLKVQPEIHVSFGPVEPDTPEFYVGIPVAAIEPALRSHLDLPEGRGLLVAGEIPKDSPAAKAGLKADDILLEFDGKPVGDREQLVKLVQETGGKTVEAKLLRAGKETKVEITPAKRTSRAVTTARGRAALRLNRFGPGVWYGGEALRGSAPNYWLPNRTAPGRPAEPALAPHRGQGGVGGSSDPRLEALSAEVKALRETISELKKSLGDKE